MPWAAPKIRYQIWRLVVKNVAKKQHPLWRRVVGGAACRRKR